MIKICVHIVQWILTPMYNVCIACTLAFVLSAVHVSERTRHHHITTECHGERCEFTTTDHNSPNAMLKPFFTFAPIGSKSQSAGDPNTQAIGLPDAKVDKDMDDDKLINKRPRIRWL